MTRPMSEKFNRPISRKDLRFTVEMVLRKVSKLWPKKHPPGDHDRLKPVGEAVVDHIKLWGMRFFGKSPGRVPMAAPSGGAGRGG